MWVSAGCFVETGESSLTWGSFLRESRAVSLLSAQHCQLKPAFHAPSSGSSFPGIEWQGEPSALLTGCCAAQALTSTASPAKRNNFRDEWRTKTLLATSEKWQLPPVRKSCRKGQCSHTWGSPPTNAYLQKVVFFSFP